MGLLDMSLSQNSLATCIYDELRLLVGREKVGPSKTAGEKFTDVAGT